MQEGTSVVYGPREAEALLNLPAPQFPWKLYEIDSLGALKSIISELHKIW